VSEHAGELAALIAAVRDLAEDAIVRGAREVDARAEVPMATPVPEAPAPVVVPAAVPVRPDWFALAAEARAEGVPKAALLERIREEIGDCRRCNLCRERRNVVFGVGSAEAELLVIGEAPGQQEDEKGEPFVGPAGQMLDKMLENVLGLRRDQVYILNVVKCRPPKNRNPLPDELDACRPFLDAQIEAIAPKVALVLGTVAYKTVFHTETGIMRARGRWHAYGDLPVMPTFHPAYLLRTPSDKRLTFEDLKLVRDKYDALAGRR
jgi:DNA polymerase